LIVNKIGKGYDLFDLLSILEVVSKPPLRPNSCVGPRDSILEILNIFLRLNPSVRLDFEPD
jgi:hypothetical protein